ncbi:uncharacterized protein [Ptychodera flava]|uniref:uncharacterized protein n=1 Tax=Ptychodera flava TaxID=63121 RepID=UPI003969D505
MLDMLQDTVPEVTSNMAILQKLLSFCKIKIGEWRQEEARKILCVEETKQKYKKMTTEELTADLCGNKMTVPTTMIQTCVALLRKFQREEQPERKGFWSSYQTWKHLGHLQRGDIKKTQWHIFLGVPL